LSSIDHRFAADRIIRRSSSVDHHPLSISISTDRRRD